MTVHEVSKRDWPRLTWIYPRIHNFVNSVESLC